MFKGFLTFLFLIIIRPQDFVEPIRGLPIVFIVMGVLVVGWLQRSEEKRLLRTEQDRYYALFFLLIVISTLGVGWIAYTIQTATDTFKIALIYWFCVTIVDSPERLKTATWTTVCFMTVVAAMGVLQFYGWDITGAGITWAPDKEVWQIKGTGLFDNPNDLAYSVVLVVPFFLGLVVTTRDPVRRGGALALLLLALFCIFLTRSRGGYLAAVTSIATWWFFWISSRNWRRVALIVGLFGILLAFSRETKGYREDESSMGRVEAWQAGMEMITEHPLIGVGKGQFMEYHSRDSHNSFVRAGAELGFVGLFAFVGILFSAFRSLYRAGDVGLGEDARLYRIGYLSYLSSFVVASLFSTRTYDIIFMVVIAFTGVISRFTLDAAEGAPSPPMPVFNRKVVGLTVLVWCVWKLFLHQV